MKTINYSACVEPQAHIATKHNRMKVYSNGEIFLEDKTEFEIELFNPTTKKVLAMISMNGSLISKRGIILRPGERMFLERFIDDNSKFVFETYEIDGKDSEAKNAIIENGTISIEFYKEKEVEINNVSYSLGMAFPIAASYHTDSIKYRSLSTMDSTLTCLNSSTISKLDDSSIETGRIERGDVSSQNFKTVTFEKENYPFKTISYKLLPISQKPITVEEINKMKTFCPNCGKKCIKKGFKFCPNCGFNLN